MTNDIPEEIEAILKDDWKFKEKLGLGEETYETLKAANIVERTVGVAGAVSGGVLIASSPLVAEMLFPSTASTGLLAWPGFGAAAATPIGWVLVAGALTGGTYYGGRRVIDAMRRKRTYKIPRYINTALDLLANQLLGLMLPLSTWIAKSDDKQISGEERESISSYYAEEWGYEATFVDRAIEQSAVKFGTGASTKTAKDLAESLSEYCAANRDCNKEAIIETLIGHLNDLVDTEGNHEYRERKLHAVREFESLVRRPFRARLLRRFAKLMGYKC